MNNKLMVNLNMFVMTSPIYLISENEVNKINDCTLKELPDTILNYSKRYNANEIIISGFKEQAEHCKKRIQNLEFEEYSTNKLNIRIEVI